MRRWRVTIALLRRGRTMPKRYSNRGLALEKLKRFDEALASYDRALRLQPELCRGLINRGIALQRT